MAAETVAERAIDAVRVELFRQRMSIAALAARVGQSHSAVSRRLNGDVDVTVAELERYAAVLDREVVVDLREVQQ